MRSRMGFSSDGNVVPENVREENICGSALTSRYDTLGSVLHRRFDVMEKLLAPQGDDGVDPGSSTRRNDSSKQRCCDADACCEANDQGIDGRQSV